MASSHDQTRKKRIDRIRPFLKDLSSGKEPKTNKAVLLLLVQDLKDEGNELFREGQFTQACVHYKHALMVARVLEERFYHEVEEEYLATLYANGSLGYLKTNKFSDALQYSEKALQLQPGNVKAKYRKVQALFSLRRYQEALLEAQDGMKKQPSIFKEYVTKAEEALRGSATEGVKSESGSTGVAERTPSGAASEEWLAETNALKTEKQREAVLKKMPNKKKVKVPTPVASRARDSSDSDVDSDSSNLSEDSQFASNYASVHRKGQLSGKPASQKKNNVVHVRPSEPDHSKDVLHQSMGFKRVGDNASKTRSSAMGLDDFSMGYGQGGAKPKAAPQYAVDPDMPSINVSWPYEDSYQFRLACRMCFIKTGEGYRGYCYNPSMAHRCDKDLLVIRRKENQSLNWIKIRPFPALFNNRFTEFKMCQQFVSSMPCKIGEWRCTFPHNNIELNLWYMEREGSFCHAKFMEELRRNGIDNSEQLAGYRAAQRAAPKTIPGLNYKTGSRQRRSSPAPPERKSPGPAFGAGPPPPQHVPSQGMTMPPPPPMAARPFQQTSSFQRMPVPPQPLVTPAASPYVIIHPAPVVTPSVPPPGSLPRMPPSAQAPQPRPAAAAAAASSKPPTSHLPSLASLHNSLKDYDYKIVCPDCFRFENFPGRYTYHANINHVCEENVLAVKQRNFPNSQWMRVRERTNHRDFPGKYIMCKSISTNKPELCRYGEFECSFAHSEAEQRIWGMEKTGKFSITDFILQNRKSESSRGFSVAELLKKYGGFFTNVCRKCFFGRPPRVSEEGPNNCCNGTTKHPWDKSLVLAHIDTASGKLTVIDKRKFTHKGAFFRICKFLHFCQDQLMDRCLSAHGFLERDVWMLERDTNVSRAELIRLSQERQHGSPQQQPPPPPPPPQQQQPQQRAWGAWGSGPPPKPPPAAPSAPRAQTGYASSADAVSGREKVPYTVHEFCGMCWTTGTRSLQDGTNNKCVKGHANFLMKRIFVIGGIMKELRTLPNIIPRNLNFVLCNFIQQKRKCQFTGPGPCQFAHSDEERVIWIWMSRNRVHRLEDVVKACKEDARRSKINQGDSVVTATTTVPQRSPVRLPTNLQNNSHYCRYCSVQCNSERQWEEHCASEKHTFNVNSDKDHQWNFRQPPWGQGSNLALCSKHMDGGGCQYSHAPDMFNLCKHAHSQEELDEWRERCEWRQMKRTLAREQNMFSYMDNLLEAYNAADSQVTEMSETLSGVQVKCKEPLEEFRQEKNAVLVWTFLIRTQLTLQKVALLHHSARLHFFLQSMDGSKHQIATGEEFEDVDDQGNPCYRVSVHFTGGMFGSFSQWLALDFGKKPVLLRKLNVELGHETVHEKVKDLRQKLAFHRWTKENRQVIPYHYTYDDTMLELMQKYKEPTSEVLVTQDSIKPLNQHNYVHKMHKMLQLEEITRHKLISTYNLVNKAEVKDLVVTELQGTFLNRNGELFLRLPLTENLTEDTGAGKLIVNSVNSVLLTRTDIEDNHRVYEASVLPEARGKDSITVCLSPVCVRELNLKAGMEVDVEVQFQMDRMHFVRMHFALDRLTSTDIVFPDITKINPLLNEQHTLKVSSKNLNSNQMQAIRYIVAERTGYTPPFIMYGPFGTGKTETLAQAAMVLLREKSSSKILICAQSNSAANLYVVKYLDPFLTRASKNDLLLRIIAKERRVESIPPAARKYCCISDDGNSFEIPDTEIVLQHRIVVTTVEMALTLTLKDLKGAFTHIFIDEAAQALECETIMPLTLATDKTCVVLTGDHLQISPKVYSAEARRQNFGVSMLERLHQYYFQFYHQLQQIPRSSALTIFLSINYRTKMEILRFISAVFYGGPDKLIASGNIPSVVERTPLLFYAVQGREVQEHDSTSFYNQAEGSEVVERVSELLDNWPQEWGKVAPEEVSVVTPYHDQVRQIRFLLKRRRPDFRKVNVETVQNIQGKEFRALFISTVRTRNLLDSDQVAKALSEADAVGGVADFAFLSDCKLLNTAMTRTKSLVAVVGDPVALCAIGDCIGIWRTYVKHCHNMRSIHPRSMDYESIKHQVVQLQLSMSRKLREVAELCNPTSQLSNGPPEPGPTGNYNGSHEEGIKGEGIVKPETFGPGDHDSEVAPAKDPEQTLTASLQSLKPVSKVKFTKPMAEKDQTTEFSLTADEILLQLAGDSVGSAEPLRIECVKVEELRGQAIVSYDPSLENEDKRRKMMQASAAGKEFDSDEVIYQEGNWDQGEMIQFYNYCEDSQKDVVSNHPDRFKLCTIHIQEDHCLAKVLNPLDPIQEVEVEGSLHCGRAFDKDEVLVEILEESDGRQDGSGRVHGRVVGIWQRAIDTSCRSFVCTANISNMGLMSPINPGVPDIYNVLLPNHVQRVKKGFVCVYQLTDNKTLTFSHYEKVEANATEGKLFVVRYLKWLPEFFNPFGVVVGVIPAGHDLTSALNILDIEHHLPTQFSSSVMEELQSDYVGGYSLPAEAYSSHTNITESSWCFTIDSPHDTDIQVAFSIDQLSDTSYKVCVHVTDVAYFVRRDSALDREALQRGTAILPIGRDPVPLVPKELSSELCCLVAGRDCCTLSVFMTVTGSGEEWHVVETSMERTIINPRQHFSYEEVENILDNAQDAESNYIKSCVLVLYQIAHMRRRQRKGNAHLDPELTPTEMVSPRAHHMVQELLIMANFQVADQLVKVFPQCTPLLQEATPNVYKLEEWKAKHAADAINSVALTKPFLKGNEVCTCSMVCMCVFSYMKEQEVKPVDHFDVVTKLWNQALAVNPFSFTSAMQKVVAMPNNHPQTSIALKELLDIIPPQQLVCSGDVDSLQQGHYRLNLPCFTVVTRPLHSYISIVVQRLMTALITDQLSPYTQQEVAQLAQACNRSQQQADSYTAANALVHLAASLQSRPLTLCSRLGYKQHTLSLTFPVVEKLDGQRMQLHFPNFPSIPEEERRISVASLQPSALPQVSADGEQVKLTWQERIYDASPSDSSPSAGKGQGMVELSADSFVSHVPPFHWQKLLAAVREENDVKLQQTVQSMQEHVSNSTSDDQYAVDVNSEVRQGDLIHHFSEFSLSLHTCMVLQLQVTAELLRGLLCPRLQLVSLTPTLDVCLEHCNSPADCFTKLTSLPAAPSSHVDEAGFQQCWMPILSLEAADTAVNSQASATIHSVFIDWKQQSSAGEKGDELCVTGKFSLSQSFCKERRIFFSGDGRSPDDLGVFGLESSCPVPYDLLCVRYKGLEMPEQQGLDDRVMALVRMGSSVVTWVGHCVVQKVKWDKKGMVIVSVRLQSSTVEMPAVLLDSSVAAEVPCTVQWIPKTMLCRQMEHSVACLTSASDLAKDIAVGRRPVNTVDQSDVGFLVEKISQQLNTEQKEAVQSALKQPFTVVQGPPGSGKTLTAAHMASLYVERNRMTPQPASQNKARAQVLICASSDTAVDVIAAHLKSLSQTAPRMVRVYDAVVESVDFPVPRNAIPPCKLKSAHAGSPKLQKIALHHLIRCPPNSFYKKIQECDSLFGLYPDNITDDQIEEYQQLVLQAQHQELQQAEVILTTCSVAASPRLIQGTNIKQIIMDSSESCMEPESLVPLVLKPTVQQVVLLGDPKQLKPAVTNSTASSLGLSRSLLERYSDSAFKLKDQYRMHLGISEMSSLSFYGGKLKVMTRVQQGPADLDVWPGSRAQPIAFCHVTGLEEMVSVLTENGAKDSFSNTMEAEAVASIVECLVVQNHVAEASVVVISQYLAHIQLIKQLLSDCGIEAVDVRSVGQCQGCEFDYVVLSTCRSLSRSEVERKPTEDWLQRHLGPTADMHQINVAITRPRKGLVITGNKDLLASHSVWSGLLEHFRKQQALVEVDHFIQALSL